MTRDQKKDKQETTQPPAPIANIADRLVTLQGSSAPEKPQAWPPTFEEYAKVCDVRMTLF